MAEYPFRLSKDRETLIINPKVIKVMPTKELGRNSFKPANLFSRIEIGRIKIRWLLETAGIVIKPVEENLDDHTATD